MSAAARHYARLGVPSTAPHTEVQAAFRALAKRYHPDTHPVGISREAAEHMFKEISASYRYICEVDRARGASGYGYDFQRHHYHGHANASTAAQQEAAYAYMYQRSATWKHTDKYKEELRTIFGPPAVFVTVLALWGIAVVKYSDNDPTVLRAGSVSKFVPSTERENAMGKLVFQNEKIVVQKSDEGGFRNQLVGAAIAAASPRSAEKEKTG